MGVGTSKPSETIPHRLLPRRGDSEGLVNWWQVFAFELDVENGSNDLHDFADMLTFGGHVSVRRRHTVDELLFLPVKANKTGRFKSQTR